MNRKVSVLMLVMFVVLAGCAASFEVKAYKTLATAGITYDAGMKTVADLQKQGKVTAEQRTEINRYANFFYTAYQTACSAFVSYKKTGAGESAVTQAITAMSAAWSTFAANANRIVPAVLTPTLPSEVQ